MYGSPSDIRHIYRPGMHLQYSDESARVSYMHLLHTLAHQQLVGSQKMGLQSAEHLAAVAYSN